ncbi:hypothetical protein ACMFMG_010064 [Clarireedia jacksonii]
MRFFETLNCYPSAYGSSIHLFASVPRALKRERENTSTKTETSLHFALSQILLRPTTTTTTTPTPSSPSPSLPFSAHLDSTSGVRRLLVIFAHYILFPQIHF